VVGMASFSEASEIYPFTTENICGYIGKAKDKKVLSVVGSGDHFLNLVNNGASQIDSFDINRHAIYYLKLKKAAAITLSKEAFYEFLINDARKYFSRVASYLDSESYLFWKEYIENTVPTTGIQKSNLFYPRIYCPNFTAINAYLKPENYSVLGEHLKERTEDRVFLGDIFKISYKLDTDYDCIYLSNILAYEDNLNRSVSLIKRLRENNLNSGGILYYQYLYNENSSYNERIRKFYEENLRETAVLDIPSFYGKKEPDKVLVLAK